MDEQPFDTINVIPFVDIMLVLLTIVLTTSSFIATGRIPINLPKASKSAEQAQTAKIIELDKAGAIYLDSKPVTTDLLKADLASLPPDTSFIVRADKSVSLQHFVNVVDTLKKLNFTKVAVQTEAS
jgi:biopolymer transport protein ExbD